MNRLIITMCLLCFSYNSSAQEPNWISLPEIIAQAFNESAPEKSKQTYVFQRCAAHYLALSELFKAASTEMETTAIQTSSILSQAATLWDLNLTTTRMGVAPVMNEVTDKVFNVVGELYQQYMSWLNNNYLVHGAYFDNDETFQLEMQLCTSIAELAIAALNAEDGNQ